MTCVVVQGRLYSSEGGQTVRHNHSLHTINKFIFKLQIYTGNKIENLTQVLFILYKLTMSRLLHDWLEHH